MRLNKLTSLLKEKAFDGALISPGTNLYYLTSLHIHEAGERLTVLVVNSNGEYHLLAPSLYENVIRDFPVTFWRDGENPYGKLAEILKELDLSSGRILVENTMRADWLIGILKLGSFESHPLSILMRELRMRKDAEEIRLMEKAAKIVDEVFEEIIGMNLIGMREKDLALKIELLIRERSDGISFEPIVASGENGANPHHAPGERKLRKGDLVILDYGARWEGYCSDITRTIALGKPDEKLLEIYEIVKNAQESAFQTVREGIKAKEVDKAVRDYIAEAGYGEYFTHRTGHGLGLDVHEEPYIGPDGEVILKNGMTFTIEPGIYVPGLGGVRIEDDVVVEGGKGRRLTKAPRELIIV
ncbi:aminopeptidase P family protein [Thermococcus sp. GR7]|uniref:M24 family metallopeptidase n=1 Tax=unclassified Thermococcus TaxID=2627626 RepID=UPI001431D4B9|nr:MULTISPECIES: Xaa-Pro peptidase family protein [unclassified Thermococcus]NJE47035.1 aminopeptidase P family protein [Thermococcus sp. GR7]NJE78140.1 aminopeptidase P family protein [Thermococcus sp. GR4]NJF22743.1 aminopeptidase P family protein [Thermococcus sp. GR5]